MAKTNWENVATYSLQAGMSMDNLRTVLNATLLQEPSKEEWKRIGETRKRLRPQLRRLGFSLH